MVVGYLLLSVMPLLLMIAIPTLGFYLFFQKYLIIFLVSIGLGFVIAWLWWSYFVVKWKLWAFRNTPTTEHLRLYQSAVTGLLIYPKHAWLNKTEIKTEAEAKEIQQYFRTLYEEVADSSDSDPELTHSEARIFYVGIGVILLIVSISVLVFSPHVLPNITATESIRSVITNKPSFVKNEEEAYVAIGIEALPELIYIYDDELNGMCISYLLNKVKVGDPIELFFHPNQIPLLTQ